MYIYIRFYKASGTQFNIAEKITAEEEKYLHSDEV